MGKNAHRELRKAYPNIDWRLLTLRRGDHYIGPVGEGLVLIVTRSEDFPLGYDARLASAKKIPGNTETLLGGPDTGEDIVSAVGALLKRLQESVEGPRLQKLQAAHAWLEKHVSPK